jgi:hypothetical protein
MKVLVPLFFVLCLVGALEARVFESRVSHVDASDGPGRPHLILLETGAVVFLPREEAELLASFRECQRRGATLAVDADERNNFIAAQTIGEGVDVAGPRPPLPRSFEPSVLPDEADALAVFKRMRRDHQRDSQCYNRAHVWAWEEFRATGLRSSKHFLFFTWRYIRNYRYKWWFHVAPSVALADETVRILDRTFTRMPLSVAAWIRNFVYSGRACPEVSDYYDYRRNQNREDCYLIPVSMYFWQPRDIERRSRTGAEKSSFLRSEVRHAYREAF